MNIPVELTEDEFVLLIHLLGNNLSEKVRRGIDTNGLPETVLNVKLLNARATIIGQKPLLTPLPKKGKLKRNGQEIPRSKT